MDLTKLTPEILLQSLDGMEDSQPLGPRISHRFDEGLARQVSFVLGQTGGFRYYWPMRMNTYCYGDDYKFVGSLPTPPWLGEVVVYVENGPADEPLSVGELRRLLNQQIAVAA